MSGAKQIDALILRLAKLAKDMDQHATDDWDEHEDVMAAVDTILSLQTLLARVLVMDRGSAEEATEALGGLPEVIRRVKAHPRPGHPTTSPDPDEVEF